MIFKQVTSDRLAALLLLNKMYESSPQPYRMQPTLGLVVSLSEYIDFCEWIQEPYILSTRTSELLSAINKFKLGLDTNELMCLFSKDLAFAQIKELIYACEYGKGATKILPEFEANVTEIPLDNLPNNWLSDLDDSVAEIDTYLNRRSYDYTIQRLYNAGINSRTLKEAVHLYHFSQLGLAVKLV